MGDAVLECLAALRHDLGKYLSLQQRWLPPDPSDPDLRDAVAADVLRTRSGPDGVQDAIQVWEPFLARLTGEAPLADGARVDLRGDPWFDRLAAEIERLRAAIPELRAGSLDRAGLLAAASAARSASDAAVALHRSRRGEPVQPPPPRA